VLPWTPGPLQVDPIRRVTEIRDPTINEEREEEGRRLRQRAEIQEEFAAPVREKERLERRRREFIAEQERADIQAAKSERERVKSEMESRKGVATAQVAHDAIIKAGGDPMDAWRIAWDWTNAGVAEDRIAALQKQQETEIKRQAERAKQAEESMGLQAARGLLPENIRPAVGPGGLTPTGGIAAAERLRKQRLEAGEKKASQAQRARARQAAESRLTDYYDQPKKIQKQMVEEAKQAVAFDDDLGAKMFLMAVTGEVPKKVRE
jgi:hypothetical protein